MANERKREAVERIEMASSDSERHTEEAAENKSDKQLKDRKFSWAKLHRVDSLNLEAGKVSNSAAGHGSKVYISHLCTDIVKNNIDKIRSPKSKRIAQCTKYPTFMQDLGKGRTPSGDIDTLP